MTPSRDTDHLTDEQRAKRERERPQRLAFCDAAMEWVMVGGSEHELVAEARRIAAKRGHGGRPREVR